MGKNKKKVNSVFKVAGAKSLKLKAKAKAVKSDLKNISIKNKNKLTEIDKALVHLEDKIRKSGGSQPKPTENKTSKLPTVNTAASQDTEKKSDEALNDLNSMQL